MLFAADRNCRLIQMSETSTKPYLMRAIYDWCTDQGYTPHISVVVDANTQVPFEHVKNGEIVLNIGALATHRLQISNDQVEFQARFGGVARSIVVPVDNVSSIYARETGHGMAFEVVLNTSPKEISEPAAAVVLKAVEKTPESTDPKPPSDGGGRPKLTRVK